MPHAQISVSKAYPVTMCALFIFIPFARYVRNPGNFCPEFLLVPENPELMNILLLDTRILGFGIRNTGQATPLYWEVWGLSIFISHKLNSTWSYENRVCKHFVISLNFPWLITSLLSCLLMSFLCFVFRFSCLLSRKLKMAVAAVKVIWVSSDDKTGESEVI